MANSPFHITTATSVFKNDGTNAFDGDNSGPDTLIVDPGAFLISTNGGGASLAPTGVWTVTLNGSIISLIGSGIFLDAGISAISTINIGVDGEVQGGTAAIVLGSSANINNAGQISGFVGGVF